MMRADGIRPDRKTITHQIPEGYQVVTIESVRRDGDHLLIQYNGRLFGGILPELLADGVESMIVPGARIIIRYHTPDSGRLNQVAHMLMWHPTEEGWIDLYADWE